MSEEERPATRPRRAACPSELEISRYLAGTLPEAEKRALETHFADCARCCQELADLVRLEPEARVPMGDAAQARVWSRIRRTLQARGSVSRRDERPANFIVLHFRPPAPTAKSYALAAATDETEAATMPTFASEDGSVLAKVVQDEGTGETSVFLVTERMAQLKGATLAVVCRDAGYQFEGMPDEDGVVNLRSAPRLVADDTHMELRFPTGSLPLATEP
jgi:anti-sigma factor RsiW